MPNSKSTTSDLFNRYIWLADTIYNSSGLTFEEIRRKWEFSAANTMKSPLTLRTFHNYRAAVYELFDVDIQCDKHNGWKYYIADSDGIGGDSLRKWMLSTLSVNNLTKESKILRDKILLEDIPSGLNYLTQVLEAIRDRNVICFRHRNFWREEERDVVLEPYCVKLCKQRWYVVGYDRQKEAVLLYALDRFTSCRIDVQTYIIPEDFDGAAFFAEYFGVYVNENVKVEKILLEVDGVSVKYFRTLPLHCTQQEVETGENYSVFEYELRPTTDFIGELVGKAEFTKVLSPVWLADEVKKTLQRMVRRQE